MSDQTNRISVRIYYEDTDFSGRVYHASFARFFERGRTEWLRQMGLRHDLLAKQNIAFAVRRLTMEFLAPAFIDDALEIVTHVASLKGPVLTFQQQASRGERALVTAQAEVVTISGEKAVRPPSELRNRLRASGVDGSVDAVAEGGEPKR